MINNLAQLSKEQEKVIKQVLFHTYLDTISVASENIPPKVLKLLDVTSGDLVKKIKKAIKVCIEQNSTEIFKKVSLNKVYSTKK